MTKEEKTLLIDEITDQLNNNDKIYLADCSSLTVDKVNQFRRACFEKKVKVRVVKNSLLKKAIEKAQNPKLKDFIPVLKGETALIFTEISNAPAKIIKDFRSKGADKPILKAAYVEDMFFLGDQHLEALAALKSKNELIAEVVSLLQSPIRRVISALENKKSNEPANEN